jgi:hypothetical protein
MPPDVGLVTLRCPPGAQDGAISHGSTQYIPYRADHRDPMSPWLVDVPREAAFHLCRNAGFVQLEPT